MIRLPAGALARALIHLAALAFALVLFVVPFRIAPVRAVAVTGLIGLLLAAVGIATHWRWPVTAAACVFLTDYAGGLLLAGAPPGVVGAAGFGLSLLFLLESVELARRVRHADVGLGAVRSQSLAWMGFGATTLAATMLAMAGAATIAAAVPYAAGPVLAALSALGVVLALAAAMTGAGRRARS